MIPLLRGQRQAHSPSAGTAESQMPSRLSWGTGRAATLLKTLLQYFGKSLEALPGVTYPGFRDNRSTLNTKTGYKKIGLPYGEETIDKMLSHFHRILEHNGRTNGWTKLLYQYRGSVC